MESLNLKKIAEADISRMVDGGTQISLHRRIGVGQIREKRGGDFDPGRAPQAVPIHFLLEHLGSEGRREPALFSFARSTR